jgi:hypothetical protein
VQGIQNPSDDKEQHLSADMQPAGEFKSEFIMLDKVSSLEDRVLKSEIYGDLGRLDIHSFAAPQRVLYPTVTSNFVKIDSTPPSTYRISMVNSDSSLVWL